MKILSYRRFALWWQLAMDWFQRQFAAIAASIDFTPVEEKLDDVEEAVESLKLTPTAELIDNGVMLHYVTMDQMEKMHIRIEGTDTGTLGFTLTKGTDNFELRFSADSPQAFAGQLVIDDSISIVDYVFCNLLVHIPTGYEVKWVIIDGVDANLLEADINWRLADIQKRIGEGGEDPYSQALAAFFNITPPVPNAVPMTQQEVEDDLDELWNLIITQ